MITYTIYIHNKECAVALYLPISKHYSSKNDEVKSTAKFKVVCHLSLLFS